MNQIKLFEEKMSKEKISNTTINIFKHYYQLYIDGEKGKLSKDDIDLPFDNQIIDYDNLSDDSYVNLQKLAVIKLNGGLGTSMGLSKAKSLLPVKDGNTFLDITAQQIVYLREEFNTDIPLIFMNSFNTSEDTLDFLKKYKSLPVKDIPLDFLQNKFPKVKKEDNKPLANKDDLLNWNPPGHGDIYNALDEINLIDKLLDKGIEFLFISNSDNLGAIVEPKILNEMIENDIDFVMEVCNRTEMDKKGGHLARKKSGELILREVAQCPDDEINEFQNIELYKYFNTNNLWIRLKELKNLLTKYKGVLPLPLILNEKKVDEIPVYQFETAMGSAISLFNKSKAVCVPRNRFLPVKKTQDLLLLWSDIYYLNERSILEKNSNAKEIIVDLDPKFYGNIEQLKETFDHGIPSLIDCNSLKIMGKILFGNSVKLSGNIELTSTDETFLENIHIKGL